jgi:hypothetical protein
MKIKLELSEELSKTVTQLAQTRGTDVAEVIRRSIGLASFFEQELAQGNLVLLKDAETDRMRQVELH